MNGLGKFLALLGTVAAIAGCAPVKKESVVGEMKEAATAEERSDFGTCKSAMLAMTRDPSTTHVPKVQSVETEENIVFEWAHKNRIKLQNAKGVELDVSGRCALSKESKQVAYLLLNGAMVH